jgi:surface carbohydrate biosynthesis protein
LFEEINPKIIFTCADNNLLVSRYAIDNPAVQVIFLQNALRDTIGSIAHGGRLPTYLSLGYVEADIFKEVDIRYRNYLPVGSVKLGLALKKYRKPDHQSFDLCFISHYRPELFSGNSPDLAKQIELSHRRLFVNLIKYAVTRDLTVVVASKTREPDLQDIEYHYFLSLAEGTPFEFVRGDKNNNEFATYWASLSSNLIVHPASTLGFEMFAAGKKVLFGASQQADLLKQWGIHYYFDLLPSFVKLSSFSEREFNKLCDYLWEMPDSDYQTITMEPARTIVAISDDKYPHEVVRQLLSEYLTR